MDFDPINRPAHYIQGGIESWQVIEAFKLSYHKGVALAYVLRSAFKGAEVDDLRKAVKHLEREIGQLMQVAPLARPADSGLKPATSGGAQPGDGVIKPGHFGETTDPRRAERKVHDLDRLRNGEWPFDGFRG